MAEVAAKEVQRLRQMAGVGMMDAKRALVETEGDMEKAMDLLRVRGMAKVAKRAGEREANQGSIGTYVHYQADRPVIGVLVDLACETDFVAKNPDFRKVADDIAMHIAWGRPRWIRREDVDPSELDRERQFFAAQAREEGKPENVIDRIVEGKVKSYYEDHVLYDQKFARTESFDGSVEAMVNDLAARMGENISVRRMAMLRIGEDGPES
ncbi:MAG TPA: elongation factor Ts [Acidimicrobiia bacterium]|nr:elongation factor Ts [Acidimicrobiia bacterium]